MFGGLIILNQRRSDGARELGSEQSAMPTGGGGFTKVYVREPSNIFYF